MSLVRCAGGGAAWFGTLGASSGCFDLGLCLSLRLLEAGSICFYGDGKEKVGSAEERRASGIQLDLREGAGQTAKEKDPIADRTA